MKEARFRDNVTWMSFLLTLLVYGFAFGEIKEQWDKYETTAEEYKSYDYDYDYDYDSDTTGTSTGSSAASHEKVRYSVGDTITVQTSNGDYSFKITGVSETAERNEYTDSDPDRVILIDYEYENISYAVEYDDYYNDKLYLGSGDFDVYDADGHAMEDYPISYVYPHSISPGHKTVGQMAYELNNDTNYVEMELDEYGYNGPGIIVDLEW